MGVKKKPVRSGAGSKRFDGSGPATYTNYGRAASSRAAIVVSLIKLNTKLRKFVESGKATAEDAAWAARVSDRIDDILGLDRP